MLQFFCFRDHSPSTQSSSKSIRSMQESHVLAFLNSMNNNGLSGFWSNSVLIMWDRPQQNRFITRLSTFCPLCALSLEWMTTNFSVISAATFIWTDTVSGFTYWQLYSKTYLIECTVCALERWMHLHPFNFWLKSESNPSGMPLGCFYNSFEIQ